MPIAPIAAIDPSPAAARAAVAVVAGLAGLAIGSFLNVVIYRVPRGLSVVRPPSFCPSCATPVRPHDNVPVVSWLVLRGRCRSCRSPISARYPLVEGLTGVLFALVGAAVGPHPAVPAMCALAATFVALAAIELDGQPSPSSVSLIGAAIGIGLFAWPAARAEHWAPLAAAGAGALGAAAAAAGLGWAVPMAPGGRGAAGAGAAAAVVSALAVGIVSRRGGDGVARRSVDALPLAAAVGAAVGFGVAA